jgi:hypothetical protein
MAIYTPTSLSPANSQGIDASINQSFSWQFNGTTQTDYQLVIYNLDNLLIYDSLKVTSSTSSHTVPAATLTNGNKYKWRVTVWENTVSATSKWVVFETYSAPTVTMDVIPSPLNKQNYTFTATYSQAQSIPLKNFRFILYDGNKVEIFNSDWIFKTTVSYEMVGLDNYTSYYVEFQITTQNNMTAKTGLVGIYTTYDIPDTIPDISLTPLPDQGSIQLDWADIKQIFGTASGSYEFINGFSILYDTETDFQKGTVSSVDITADGTLILSSTSSSGSYLSDVISISLSERLKSSKIVWNSETNQSNSISVFTSISVDGGTTFDEWQLCENNKPIPNFSLYDDLSDIRLKYKIEFATDDLEYLPKLFNITLEINSSYIHLFDGSSVEYSETITQEFTATFFLRLPSTFTGVFMELDDDYKIGYNGERFYYQRGYRYTAGQKRVLPTVDFRVGVKGTEIVISTDDYIEILK